MYKMYIYNVYIKSPEWKFSKYFFSSEQEDVKELKSKNLISQMFAEGKSQFTVN